MPKTRHPLFKAKAGDWFRLPITEACFAYVRVLNGSSLGVLPVLSRKPIETPDPIRDCSPKWFFEFIAPNDDATAMVCIGNSSFSTPSEGWPPPRFEPPDAFQGFYRILEKGDYRQASASEVEGLHRAARTTPARLKQFMESVAAECRSVDGSITPNESSNRP